MNTPLFKEVEDHITYKNKSNKIIPSVTTILKIINKKELLYWANILGIKGKYVQKELESSAYIGTVTHKLIEAYVSKNILYDIDTMRIGNLAERICIKRAFASFLKYYIRERNNIEVINTELSLSGERYGGTIDLLDKYNKKITITDYKTSSSFYPAMFLQLAGYDLLLRETKKIKTEQYKIILLNKKNGDIAKIKICNDKKEMTTYRDCFKKLVEFYYDWFYINQAYWNRDIN